jgi:hypothetical protein
VGHDLAPGEHAFDQQFELAAGGLLAEQARLDHLRVVEHQQVAGAQQEGKSRKTRSTAGARGHRAGASRCVRRRGAGR